MKLFYELLQVATGHRDSLSATPSANEWALMYDLAQKHCVQGITFAAVDQLAPTPAAANLPRMMLFQWIAAADLLRKRNRKVNAQCVQLCDHLRESGFRTCVLKGQGTAALYGPLSELRTVGDIDVWAMPHDVRRIKESRPIVDAFVHRQFPNEKGAFIHIGYPFFEEPEVEMHYIPTMGGTFAMDRRYERLFEQRQDACFGNATKMGFAVPEGVVNVVFNLRHIQGHFISEGIGLRHVLDFYFVLKALADTGDKAKVEEARRLVADFGMNRFFTALLWVIAEVVENWENTMAEMWGVEPDERLGRVLLREMLVGGNFGRHDARYKDKWHASIWKRWATYLKLSTVRFRYFPKETFYSWMFRLRVGFWRRTGVSW